MYQVVVYLVFAFALHVKSFKVEVNVKQGKLMGTRGETVFDGKVYFAFYGVPYAQPPVGKLRFKDPKPPKKWNRPFDATIEYHGACAQAHIVHTHGVYGFEDCLHLNIYTPSLPRNGNTDLKSVIFWVHGYTFTSSFSHIHGSDFLIDNGVLFVSVTHRLGAFGFLKINESDTNANMGLKDIVMALTWVRKNIIQFGGDKNKITVMGSGSAATFLSLLLMTDSNKKFSKMILQSGAIFSPSLFQGNQNLEKSRLEEILRKRGFLNLRNAPTKEIIKASLKIYNSKDVIDIQRPLIPFMPTLEVVSNKSLLTKRPEEVYERIASDARLQKTILVGFNSQESISEVIPFIHNPHLLKSFASSFKFMVPFSDGCKFNYTTKSYKLVAKIIKNRYFRDGISDHSVERFLWYTSDLIKYPIYKFIATNIRLRNNNIYMYKFHYNGNFSAVKATSMAGINSKIKGSSNGDEICYILKCEPLWDTYVKVNRNRNNGDRIFIKQITELWANFAKTGDPTPNTYIDNVTWPPVTVNKDNVLLISKVNKLVDSTRERTMFTFWNDIYSKYYSSEHCNSKNREEL